MWGATEHLLALLIDSIGWTNYLLQKQLNPAGYPQRPQPVTRPGAEKPGTRIGSDPIPVGDFDAWWEAA